MSAIYPITKGARQFTREDVQASGFADGFDGIREYPPSVWGTDNDPGPINSPPDREYVLAYKAGREAWKKATGSYPSSGSALWDGARTAAAYVTYFEEQRGPTANRYTRPPTEKD